MVKPTFRLFFALWPEATCRIELAAAQCVLQANIPARWIKPENLHMTLAFLGDVEVKARDGLAAMAKKIQSQNFELLLDRVEYWRKPQVICLTPTAHSPILEQLANDLATGLRNEGYSLEKRPWHAHLTLARRAAYLSAEARLENPIFWKSTDFVLAASTRDALGSTYTVLESWPLSQANPLRADNQNFSITVENTLLKL